MLFPLSRAINPVFTGCSFLFRDLQPDKRLARIRKVTITDLLRWFTLKTAGFELVLLYVDGLIACYVAEIKVSTARLV
jgi:hypothetical protein